MPAHVHPQEIDNCNGNQSQHTGIDKSGPNSPNCNIIRNQEIRLPDNGNNSSPYFICRLKNQPRSHKINRHQGKNQKLCPSGQRSMISELV